MAEPLEIERKYLIKYPDIEKLKTRQGFCEYKITQVYLKSENGANVRVRRSECCGKVVYTRTEKTRISAIKRIEREREITRAEYNKSVKCADDACAVIEKTRIKIYENGHCYEIDLYPFWKTRATMEVELKNERQKVYLPDFVKIIREVTEDKRYTNHELARRIARRKIREQSK